MAYTAAALAAYSTIPCGTVSTSSYGTTVKPPTMSMAFNMSPYGKQGIIDRYQYRGVVYVRVVPILSCLLSLIQVERDYRRICIANSIERKTRMNELVTVIRNRFQGWFHARIEGSARPSRRSNYWFSRNHSSNLSTLMCTCERLSQRKRIFPKQGSRYGRLRYIDWLGTA